MSEMKMSEVFDLPVSVEGFNLNDGYIGGAGGMTISNFDCEFENTLSISMAEHAARAINNHDRMVEEIAELREALEKSSEVLRRQLSKYYYKDEVAMLNQYESNKKLLNQLKDRANGK